MNEVTVANFDSAILSTEGLAAVYFHAPWCKASEQMTPLVEAAESEYADTPLVSVNTDICEEIVSQVGIRTIPSLGIFRDGKLVSQIRGPGSEEDFKQSLSDALQAG